jgi:hypothetical protein
MSTKREQILAALKTKLDAVSQATGGVFRSRLYALKKDQQPAISIEPISDNADPSMIGVIDWSMLVRVAVIVRGDIATNVAPETAADPIVNAVHSRMISDRSLGGLTMDIEPVSANFELQPGDQPIGVVSLGYRVQYRTSANDLSA